MTSEFSQFLSVRIETHRAHARLRLVELLGATSSRVVLGDPLMQIRDEEGNLTAVTASDIATMELRSRFNTLTPLVMGAFDEIDVLEGFGFDFPVSLIGASEDRGFYVRTTAGLESLHQVASTTLMRRMSDIAAPDGDRTGRNLVELEDWEFSFLLDAPAFVTTRVDISAR